MRFSLRPIAGSALLAALAVAPAFAADCPVPVARDDGWTIAAPAAAGMDGALLCGLLDRLAADKDVNVHGIVVARRGKLVFERYFGGEDERWGRRVGRVEHGVDTLHDMRSISKSATSLLTGIALARGALKSLDAPVVGFFPEYADLDTPERRAITIRHLLTMSVGMAWDEDRPYSDPANSESAMYASADPWRYALERPLVEKPGAVHVYNGGATTLLGRVLARATGKPLDVFAREALFAPLGITAVDWGRFPDGEPMPASGLRLRTRDLARIGQMVLDGGKAGDRPVVPADWIAESTTPRVGTRGTYFYGYQWWLGRSLVRGRETAWVAGVGYGGQRLFVVPRAGVVVAMTAGMYRSALQRTVPFDLLNLHVLPAAAD